MNQEKIGHFIAKCRKEKKMTQSELAEKLGVTDKSISNWENARCMPDLSLFKPLCDELDISINDLISGEKVKKELYQEKLEENIMHTINYTSKTVHEKNQKIGMILLIFGVLITLIAISIFPSESSWSSFYSIIGEIISLIGFSKFTKKLSYRKRILCNSGYFIIFTMLLLVLDYVNVMINHQAPRFSLQTETINNMIIYQAPAYRVYRINYDTNNEYYVIDTKGKYTKETVPLTPFNREKSGIDNIIQYKNKYIGNNSNDSGLISSLPLSEYGYVFEIDSQNLGLTIDYHITDWYINENGYLEKSLVYNSVSIFALISNVQYLRFNFSGKTYQVNRNQIETLYPQYQDIIAHEIDKDNFNQYLEQKMNDDIFVDNIFYQIFES